MSVIGVLKHFGASLRQEDLEQALAYAERFPGGIEVMIAANEETGQRQ
jgi:hypothetical protein